MSDQGDTFCPSCGHADWPHNCPTACVVGRRFRALVAERDEAQRLAVQATEEAEKYRKQAGVTEYHQLRRTHTEKRLADEEDRADMAEARVAELEKALGGFIWLDNNRHNIGTPTWTGFFVAAVDDARAALAAKEGT